LPYVAKFEKAGIPTVVVNFIDQDAMVRNEAAAYGVPNIRFLHASRTIPGPEDVDSFIEPMMRELTRPLTEKEKGSGRWEGPSQQRVLFEGTLEEAETFYNQTEKIPSLKNAFISVYTDGLPITVPTEERIEVMLTGTSHKPDEVITYQSDIRGNWGVTLKKGDPVEFMPMGWSATVEKVAINAVMAGCKPEHLPVVLAIAASGGGTGDGRGGGGFCVSGPIAKEIGMNFSIGMFGPGNAPNKTIGRTSDLMWRNLGGSIPGVSSMVSNGNIVTNGGICFAEDIDELPPGWKGLNEEYGFKKDESVVLAMRVVPYVRTGNFPNGGYRALQKSGHGGVARRLGVKGVPGLHNWMEYILPGLWSAHEGGFTFILPVLMARDMQAYGFKSKDDVYEWLYNHSFESLKEYMLRAGPDLTTNGWMGIERTSGKHWRELPEDYMVPLMNSPFDNCIIVAGGEEETPLLLSGRSADPSMAYSIDYWR